VATYSTKVIGAASRHMSKRWSSEAEQMGKKKKKISSRKKWSSFPASGYLASIRGGFLSGMPWYVSWASANKGVGSFGGEKKGHLIL